jgi:hypothetical protein
LRLGVRDNCNLRERPRPNTTKRFETNTTTRRKNHMGVRCTTPNRLESYNDYYEGTGTEFKIVELLVQSADTFVIDAFVFLTCV